MSDRDAQWDLERFLPALDIWIERERPDDELRTIVTAWIFTRREDPFEGVRRQEGFENLWFGAVPLTAHTSGEVVVCSYWIEWQRHVVRCDSFATLNLPL